MLINQENSFALQIHLQMNFKEISKFLLDIVINETMYM